MIIESYVNKLIFVDEEFMRELKQESVSAFHEFNNPSLDTQVIQLPSRSDQLSHLIKSMDISEIKAGNILIKPGYTNRFWRIEEFSENHVLSKYRLWIQLCVALGAKRVQVKDIKDVSTEVGRDYALQAEASVSSPMVNGNADASSKKSSRENEIKQQIIDISADAEGSEPNLEAAEKILKRYNLFYDDLFMSIYEMRELRTNPLKKHEFSLDFSSDLNKAFDSSTRAKLDVMAKIYKGRIALDSQENAFNNARTAMKLSILVEF